MVSLEFFHWEGGDWGAVGSSSSGVKEKLPQISVFQLSTG